ncbi:MAG: hypothetical protein IJJ40_04340 [Clostridia bacterium]|nr:hypothetical protein [Clostridia bacterium]
MHNKIKYVFIRWLSLLLSILILFVFITLRIRVVVFEFAKSSAKNILINASNKAVLTVLKDNDIKYDDISRIYRDSNGNVSDIQIDTTKINTLKALINNEMYKLTDSNDFNIKIPLGSLINNEFTSGMGPRLNFKMSIAHTADINYKTAFVDAGINNVLHQIIIVTDIDCSVLSFGTTRSFSFKNEILAAESVIAGAVPDSYTSVYETDPNEFADDVFNYGK